jgi:hypothetical protein
MTRRTQLLLATGGACRASVRHAMTGHRPTRQRVPQRPGCTALSCQISAPGRSAARRRSAAERHLCLAEPGQQRRDREKVQDQRADLHTAGNASTDQKSRWSPSGSPRAGWDAQHRTDRAAGIHVLRLPTPVRRAAVEPARALARPRCQSETALRRRAAGHHVAANRRPASRVERCDVSDLVGNRQVDRHRGGPRIRAGAPDQAGAAHAFGGRRRRPAPCVHRA